MLKNVDFRLKNVDFTAGGTAPPLGEYKLLANCKCYHGPELDSAPRDYSLDAG